MYVNVREQVGSRLSFHPVDPAGQISGIKFDSKHLCQISYLADFYIFCGYKNLNV